MKAKQIDFTYEQYLSMLDDAKDTKTVVAVVVIAMGQRSRKKFSDLHLANILSEAGCKINTFI